MTIGEADFAHVEDDRFRSLIRYWLDARGGRAVPSVDAIDPSKFRYVLEQVWLCAVEDEPRDFRYRVVGEHIRAAYTEPLVGRTLSEVTDRSVIERVMGYFNLVVDGPTVVHVIGRVYAEEDSPARGERLILPFVEPDTGRVTRVLGATVHSWERRGVGPDGEIPFRQVRTFTPVSGGPPWCENWL